MPAGSLAARPVRAALAAALCLPLLALAPAYAIAQQDTTTLILDIAGWLPGWEEGGGWGMVPAGQGPGKWMAFLDDTRTHEVPAAAYDVYWVQTDGAPPVLLAAGVGGEGGDTVVPVATGVRIEIGDWVPRDDAAFLLAATLDDELVSAARDTAMFLPPGEYYLYWDSGADAQPVILAYQEIEAPFGGVGLQILAVEGGVEVVDTVRDGAGALAGLKRGDVVLSVDGIPLAGLTVTDAAAALRGAPGSMAELLVRRGGAEPLTVSIVRQIVLSPPTIAVNSGIRIGVRSDVPLPDPATGWWGAGPTGGGVETVFSRASGIGETLIVPPGTFDVWWQPNADTPPQLKAVGVVVPEDGFADVAITARNLTPPSAAAE